MWPTTTLTPSDLPRTVRGRPQASVAVVTQLVTHPPGCVAREGDAVAVATGLIPRPGPAWRYLMSCGASWNVVLRSSS
jgi:hypothetical protein